MNVCGDTNVDVDYQVPSTQRGLLVCSLTNMFTSSQ
jgi:hypothetical protein